MSHMAPFLLHRAFLLCFLWGVSDGRRLPRQTGTPQAQSQVVLVGTSGCNVNDKEYKVGEEWTTGHLRYKCNELGYNIVGCALKSGKVLKINEDFVNNNTAHRCYRVGNATRTYYQEFTCGVTGAPSCELKPITQESENKALGGFLPLRAQPIIIGQLPPGWKIVDDQGKPVDVKSGATAGGTQTIVSSTRVTGESGNAGSGAVGAPLSVASKTGGMVARAAGENGAAVSGMTGMAGTHSSVTWNGKSKGGIGVGPGTFTIRSGPTGSATSFVPAGASTGSG